MEFKIMKKKKEKHILDSYHNMVDQYIDEQISIVMKRREEKENFIKNTIPDESYIVAIGEGDTDASQSE